MAPKFPKQTLVRKEETLDDYQGSFTDQLRQLLKIFSCPTRIPVNTITYYDGRMLSKYRVSIQLPEKIGLYHDLPIGEGRSHLAAYLVAVVEAIANIREQKTKELESSTFSVIPHDSIDSEPILDHLTLVKKHPKLASKFMDRYRTLFASFYKTHQVIVEDKNDMLEDLTDPERRKQLAFQLEKEAGSSATPIFKDITIDPKSFIPYPYSPRLEPIHDRTMDIRYAVPQGLKDGSDSEL